MQELQAGDLLLQLGGPAALCVQPDVKIVKLVAVLLLEQGGVQCLDMSRRAAILWVVQLTQGVVVLLLGGGFTSRNRCAWRRAGRACLRGVAGAERRAVAGTSSVMEELLTEQIQASKLHLCYAGVTLRHCF
jgi:hypothetical protein